MIDLPAALVGFGVKAAFWSKADASGGPDVCWRWNAATNGDGYGQFHFNGHQTNATRFAHLLSGGEAPGADQVVMHRCDNPACVNPAHLLFGTQADNMADKVAKGRGRAPRGEAHGAAVLSDADVIEIKRRIAANDRGFAIAKDFGVSQQLICDIRKGRRWAHVEVTP